MHPISPLVAEPASYQYPGGPSPGLTSESRSTGVGAPVKAETRSREAALGPGGHESRSPAQAWCCGLRPPGRTAAVPCLGLRLASTVVVVKLAPWQVVH